jgi:hypothetical protein
VFNVYLYINTIWIFKKNELYLYSMKKIVLTESQLKMVKTHISESAVGGDRYGREVSVDVSTYGAKINGNDIDWAVCSDIKVTYLIEMEHRSWGIKGISLYSIQGPSEVELTITPQVEDGEDINITVPLNWDNIEQETQEGEGVVTIGNEITINLTNNENGDIIVESIHVPVYTL